MWYQWPNNAIAALEKWLHRLEYRWYDSAGIVIFSNDHSYKLIKAVGKVSNLSHAIVQAGKDVLRGDYNTGIAHTRRATHGAPSEVNTHPHHDTDKRFFVVHNGIIENQRKLKDQLLKEWYQFYSETDTEVIPALLAKYRNGNLLETVEKVLPLLTGAYALLITCTECPGEIIGVKRWSPLLFGMNKDTHERYFSSDAQALVGFAQEIIHLQDGELVALNPDNYIIKTQHSIIEKATKALDVATMEADKWNYEHFMLKEIHEQASVMKRIFFWRVDFATKHLEAEAFHGMQDEQYEHIVLVGCGTSYNAGLVGAYWLESIAGIQAQAEISSEYINKRIPTDPKTLHIFLSQSGETADSIEVLKYIKAQWGKTFGIVNVVGSTMSQLTDHGFFMRAGFEIGVASTKAFTAQLSCLMLLVLFLAKKRGLTISQYDHLLDELQTIPTKIESIIAQHDHIHHIAQELSHYHDMFYLGRARQYPIACEWSLKMKEISYIHSESYPAGELKHGPLALIDEQVPSIILIPHDEHEGHNISSMSEVQARKWKILAISNKTITQAERNIVIPETNSYLAPFLTTIVVQLLAYHTAHHLGREIDKPRNLAKSVTVK